MSNALTTWFLSAWAERHIAWDVQCHKTVPFIMSADFSVLDKLARDINETVIVGVRGGNHILIIYKALPPLFEYRLKQEN